MIDGRSLASQLWGDPGSPREWIYSYLGDRRIVRTKHWLLEDDSPRHPGRLYYCGTSRDGTGYQEVTDSRDPEVMAARKMMQKILADKPVPEVPEKDATASSQGKAKKLAEKNVRR